MLNRPYRAQAHIDSGVRKCRTVSICGAARLTCWVNSTKIANFPGNTINTAIDLPDFSTVTIIEVDTKGAYIRSLLGSL